MSQMNVIHVLRRKIIRIIFLIRSLKFSTETSKIQHIRVSLKNGNLEIISQNGFETRNQSTLIMILQVIDNKLNNKVRELNIYTGDFPEYYQENYFYYCVDNKSKLDQCIPDFTFYHWKEAGILSYQDMREQLLSNSVKAASIDKLFWAGNINTHYTRKDFIDKFEQYKDIFDIHHIDPTMPKNQKFTLLDHQNYKYLIDIQGNGYSGRLKYLLHTGRLLFIQERKWKSFYHFDLLPFVHYIPIAEDFSDLINKLNWARENEAEADEIAQNAKKYATEFLDYSKVSSLLKKKIFDNG